MRDLTQAYPSKGVKRGKAGKAASLYPRREMENPYTRESDFPFSEGVSAYFPFPPPGSLYRFTSLYPALPAWGRVLSTRGVRRVCDRPTTLARLTPCWVYRTSDTYRSDTTASRPRRGYARAAADTNEPAPSPARDLLTLTKD
jgi:hypothetical protein